MMRRVKSSASTAFALIELLACQPKLQRRQTRGAFTLIELLVVMAIISLLVAILLPSLSRAKQLAIRTTCMSQMRNIGVTLLTYHAENGALPDRRGQAAGDHPHILGYPYSTVSKTHPADLLEAFAGTRDIFYCPANSQDRSAETWWPNTNLQVTAITYQMPFWVNHTEFVDDKPDYSDSMLARRIISTDFFAANHPDGSSPRVWNHGADGPEGMSMLWGDGHVIWRDATIGWTPWMVHGGLNWIWAGEE
jgi:prepilin-type N-terminal cleavage/methylation domain-containing protein